MRPLLSPDHVAPAASAESAGYFPEILVEVQQAIASHPVVVVGMAQNPHVRNIRRALASAGVAHHYLEYGSYFSQWKRRLAIKMWSGWPTFPQVFVRGVLIGGEDLTKAALADGSLRRTLDSGHSAAS